MRQLLGVFVVVLLHACSDSTADSHPASPGAGGSGSSAGATSAGSGGTAASTGGTTGNGGDGVTAGAGVVCAAEPEALGVDPATMPQPDPALEGQSHEYFAIHVEDAQGNPVPGATLRTVNDIELTSDDNGVVAFYEPGLMNTSVFFHVTHPGYEHAQDAFGYRGKAVDVSEGGTATFVLAQTSGTAAPAQGDLASRLAASGVPDREQCFAIQLLDPVNGRGVPLVRLTANGQDYWSDNQGMIAFCDPDRLGTTVTFDVFSHGYALPGGAGTVELEIGAGISGSVELERTMLAERLYRVTGGGGYRDSLLLELQTPLANPVINGLVAGSDTASTAVYRGRLFWMWQDTDRFAYPLGNFRGTSATSALPSDGGVSPHLGADTEYFVGDDGFAKPISEAFAPDNAPVWIAGLVSVPDAGGEERLFGGYAKVEGLGATVEAGVMVFDDESETFQRVVTDLLEDGFVRPDGHAFKFRHGADEFVYYPERLRIPANAEAMVDRDQYEQFSPYAENGSSELLSANDGSLDYAFRPAALHATSELLSAAAVSADQDLDGHETDIETGEGRWLVAASTAWNAHRKRFLRVTQQVGEWGDLYHAEADTPMGPWVYTQRVIDHDQYTFYNPFHHPEFDQNGGRIVFLEGTYTTTFTEPPPSPTPRFDYNQVMYRLDLTDERLAVPVAVYEIDGLPLTKRELRPGVSKLSASFFAQDHAVLGAVPVAWSGAACEPRSLLLGADPASTPVFYALPADTSPAPTHTVPLYEYTHADGRRAYSVDDAAALDGFERVQEPFALVWENPIRVNLPVGDYLGELIAVAGDDQCVSAGGVVTLDASASVAQGAAIARYVWRVPGLQPCELVEGQRLELELPPGLHSIELTVVDEAGNVSSDTLIVRVT